MGEESEKVTRKAQRLTMKDSTNTHAHVHTHTDRKTDKGNEAPRAAKEGRRD